MPTVPCGNSKPPLPTRSLSFLKSRARSAISALNHGCIMPIPLLPLQTKSVICREAEGLVTELWFFKNCCKKTDCALSLCYVNAANQRTIVEIEILATVSWTCGCQPFSCPCSPNVTALPKRDVYVTCLFQESIPAIPCAKSKPPLPTRSLSFLRAAYVPPSLH